MGFLDSLKDKPDIPLQFALDYVKLYMNQFTDAAAGAIDSYTWTVPQGRFWIMTLATVKNNTIKASGRYIITPEGGGAGSTKVAVSGGSHLAETATFHVDTLHGIGPIYLRAGDQFTLIDDARAAPNLVTFNIRYVEGFL